MNKININLVPIKIQKPRLSILTLANLTSRSLNYLTLNVEAQNGHKRLSPICMEQLTKQRSNWPSKGTFIYSLTKYHSHESLMVDKTLRMLRLPLDNGFRGFPSLFSALWSAYHTNASQPESTGIGSAYLETKTQATQYLDYPTWYGCTCTLWQINKLYLYLWICVRIYWSAIGKIINKIRVWEKSVWLHCERKHTGFDCKLQLFHRKYKGNTL